jgi:hypothetical protein
MGESLTERRRVSDEGPMGVKLCQREENLVVIPARLDGTIRVSTG